MKRLLFTILILIPLVSCQEKEADPVVNEQDVVFNAMEIIPSQGLKSTANWECKELEPDYAWITINGFDHFPALYRLDGKLYTQAIKLAPGNYTVSRFLLMDDHATPGNTADDEIVMATPDAPPAPYGVFVSKPLDFDFSVVEFTKSEIEVEVLCFEDNDYLEFGFDWFAITEIIVREQCFFGDFCVKHPLDYTGSDYARQSTGLQIDMPAIFKIIVLKNGAPIPNGTFTNASAEANWGVGSPVCVQYPDNLNVEGDEFTFELWIYVKTGNTFSFKKFHTWVLEDEEMIPSGDDGVVDFVLGSCNLTSPDLQLAPYQDLPTMASIAITSPADPGYWRVYINSVSPAGTYDLQVHVNLTGWCGDKNNTIGNGNHNMNVYTSLYSTGWPAGLPITLDRIARVNWLFNHLDIYGMDILTLSDGEGDMIQNAIWKILNGTATSGLSLTMADDAETHGDFVPLPGGWAAVLFVKSNLPGSYQLIFTMIDP
jgi:hypothetical protein